VLEKVSPREVYRGAVTATMRMVFLLYAEDRDLLPVRSNQLYAESYGMHSLFDSLRAEADRLTEDILDRRSTAWGRLLATSRAVHGGVRHDALRLPAYGGELFDPDRYPWLARLRVDDRTMLRVLDRLLMLRREGRASIEAKPLSYRSLDVEQIGYVYEGLLDHSGLRAEEIVLALVGPAQPEIPLSELEALAGDELVAYLVREMSLSKRKVNAATVRRMLDNQPDRIEYAALRAACGGDDTLTARVLPYWGLLRPDLRGGPLVFLPGAIYVTQVGDRREAGAHYTPKHLAEEMVTHTLDPLCYSPGPADGLGPDDDWRVRKAEELLALRVADIAVGSGAFLVSACRYLSQRVVEAWERDGIPDGVPNGDTPDAIEERLVYARRLVADRCLYGVDRDDMAVEMAKLSMWLVTLAKDRPFEFLKHALRRGDSLLGITDPDQLLYLHLDPVQGRKLKDHVTLFEDAAGAMSAALAEARSLRTELESRPVNDIRDAQDKETLLVRAQQHTRALRLIADATVAAALARGRSEADYESALTLVRTHVQGVLAGDAEQERQLVDQTQQWLQAGRPANAPVRECLHWPLEFPEVIEAGGFSAIVGNPPFQGGQKITGSQGTDYRDHLVHWVAGGQRGSADLVAYFFLRATEVASAGRIGLIATNTIGQGDTREVGLDRLTDAGWSIVRAVKSIRWPGEATLEVSKVWLGQAGEAEAIVLDDNPVRAITPALDPASRVTGTPHRLAANAGIAFIGSYILGMGFTMTPDEAQDLIARDPRNAEVLFPYLNGEDLNSRPDCSASRWVINFHDWPLKRAEQYPECMERVIRLVKPERARNNDRSRREIWWRFTRPAVDLQRAVAGLDRVLAIALVSRTVMPTFVRSGIIYAHKLAVFAMDDAAALAFMSSGFHSTWAWAKSSTMKADLNYSPSDVFETLARPDSTERMRTVGERLDSYRRGLMLARNEGLTKTYNRVHDPDERAADIVELRNIHVEIDHAVAEAYGWHDLTLDHDFHETRQGIRYTVGPTVRQEILDRLLELNFARYSEEEARGLHDKKGKSARTKTAKIPKPRAVRSPEAPSLFDQLSQG
jgi:hypothetical protein